MLPRICKNLIHVRFSIHSSLLPLICRTHLHGRGSHTGPNDPHSRESDVDMLDMRIKVMPTRKHNYMYLIIDKDTRDAAAVDPVDPYAMVTALHMENVNIKHVLTTHHHKDHAGGNKLLRNMWYQPITVYGGDRRVNSLRQLVRDQERLQIGRLNVLCLHTPCHTMGSICYFVESPSGERAVFTGDTLFQGGCGPFIEGSGHEMFYSLTKLAALPGDTLVFGGHENTVLNLLFAQKIEPLNKAIMARLGWAKKRRRRKLTTMPSTIREEKHWNPFMRLNEYSVRHYGKTENPDELITLLRKEFDEFTEQQNQQIKKPKYVLRDCVPQGTKS